MYVYIAPRGAPELRAALHCTVCTMTEDKEVTRQVWDGKIPIAFTLASDEVTSDDPPVTYYVLAPRSSYLTLVTDAVQRHFLNSISEPPDTEDEIWFDSEGIPLKWHWPIGVLFDLYGSSAKLPWSLTVHFQVCACLRS